jgi:Holliday junction resolvase RusA-like endonuclease
MAKLVLDALNKEAFEDDSLVVELNLRKFFCEKNRARTEIVIRELGEIPKELELKDFPT